KEGITKTELEPYIKQKPNKRIFGARFYLGLYNMSNINKKKWPNSWLRSIGEEPVVYDSAATDKSRQELRSFIFSKGYFDSRVTDTVITEKRKSDVYYNVNLKAPYTIRNLYYEFADTSIKKLFDFDSVNCLIERGKHYDVDVLQTERTRFEKFIKDKGYYSFSGDDIYFNVDSTIDHRQVNIYYGVRKLMKIDQYNRVTYVPHSIYQIKNIYIYPDFVPKEALENGEAYLKSLDTINYEGYYFIARKGRPPIKYDLILRSLYLKPGSIYSLTNTEQSKNHLMGLKVYRLVNIFFNELPPGPGSTPGAERYLNCQIQMTLLSQQSFSVEVEGTNTAGNLGGALNLIYQHKNLLHAAEQFNIKLKGAFEAATGTNANLPSTLEYGFESSLRLPKFLFLGKKSEFVRKNNPTTTILAAYDYQAVSFYTRDVANATFGYNWTAHNYQTHIVNPVQLNFVHLISIDSLFKITVESSSYLASSYRSVLILGGNYSFIFNNQKIQKSRDYWFLRVNAEAAGNMLSLASGLTKVRQIGGSYVILGQPFAQYIRADLDLRYNVIINAASSVVYRIFAGAGFPYGNSKAMPFEKQYFGGGSNDIRAWQVRSLGPGSYVNPPSASGFINQTADIKLEGNAEYRFKLFWIMQGAVFVDAGNIWTIRKDVSRPGASFKFNKFFNDIAVGPGVGLRFDIKFAIARVDLGMKLRDPSIEHGSKWIPVSQQMSFKKDFNVVFGIGYPF
ncbi:MAG: BamA/TamA family outer membrane protein, partial [Bacteroidales bacterium]